MANLMVSFNFTPDAPSLPWQRNWDKNGYNSFCVRDICEIFASIGEFSGMGYWMLSVAFSPTDPVAVATKLRQNWL